jgi:hypothetical protein
MRTKKNQLAKAARLCLLMQWQTAGALDGLTLQAIANKFTTPPNRSTILRDLRDIEQIKIEAANGNA